jgi:spore coat protein U-like protein
LKLRACALLLALALPVPAVASNSFSGQLRLTAAVVADCIVTAPSTIDFGSYNPATQGPGSPLDLTSAAVSIACTKGATSVTIALDQGAFGSGSYRNMQSDRGNGTIRYEIYTDQQYTTVWNTNNKVSYLPVNDGVTTIPLFGQVPGGQTPLPGRYSDTLLVLVSF